ncbi:MAG TPA: FmdB family zinc ribbon protein [Candidatus Limnocylindria bacterium]|nr:FmdB family zinc ribbon protein [Candidatus Limnocylindria bacterium]
MPTYDYQCRSCGHTTEVIHSMLEEGPTTCDRCGGELRRVMFPAGIIFKGSGFYKTDSRSSGAAASSASTSKAASGEGSASSGAGESSSGGPSGSGEASTKGGTAAPNEGSKGSVAKESAGT